MNPKGAREAVRERYGLAARRVLEGGRASCCGSGASPGRDTVTGDLYSIEEISGMPRESVLASLGCGNPTALAELAPGETVLDLGSGGGLDVLLSARRVGASGKAYGLDMTDEMLVVARRTLAQSGLTNVEFLKGEIEKIPLPDDSVDVVISNCVINLAADKDRVLREVFRVLRPGGRVAVSDIVTQGEIPDEVRHSMELWVGCVAGALDGKVYAEKLRNTGFVDASVERTRVCRSEDAPGLQNGQDAGADRVAAALDAKFASAFIRARKPANRMEGV